MLAVDGLTCRYGRIEALHGVSLRVGAGEIVALVGSNGAGKTTLLRALSGVQPVTAGTIRFDGASVERLKAHRRVRAGMAHVPEARQVFGPLSVEDNLRLGAWTRRRAGTQHDLDGIYATFPALADKRTLAAAALSGGQQQMLAIGRALMAKPKLLLLDEPSMGLAPLLVAQVFSIIADLRGRGLSILLVEQNAQAALAIADRGYVLETGTIAHEGTGRALRDDPKVAAAYLGIA